MYLSKLILNGQDRTVQADLSNAHKLHQRIMQAFPDEQRDRPRDDWNILFRQEVENDVVLVQSEIDPDWSRLPPRYLVSQAVKAWDLEATQLSVGRVFQFRLRANPSKRDNQSRKTIGLFHRPDQLAWLERQAERCGFQLHGVDVIPSPNVYGLKGKGSSPIRISTALYQGVLEVKDPLPLLTALQQGIGRGKSYGCGLLSITRFQG
ncbi:MAG: type I-E CRISPR-associated protein Cas6/Cse3/CasE [Plectolyngbya sp. WJT66-NPBG17]|jgi:CRISPR system Cascade subunit CasE|nr:type I-E CRISPR-associated protein Cas6/Cse3/CasE [Plectolyngbya sp. WJT66-NPBG17]